MIITQVELVKSKKGWDGVWLVSWGFGFGDFWCL